MVPRFASLGLHLVLVVLHSDICSALQTPAMARDIKSSSGSSSSRVAGRRHARDRLESGEVAEDISEVSTFDGSGYNDDDQISGSGSAEALLPAPSATATDDTTKPAAASTASTSQTTASTSTTTSANCNLSLDQPSAATIRYIANIPTLNLESTCRQSALYFAEPAF